MTINEKIWYFVQLIVVILVITLVSSYLVLIANGYRINLQTKKIQKTGMIYVKSTPKEANIYLENQLKFSKTPAKIADLLPSRYELKLEKENYQTWQKTLFVESGLVAEEGNIVLFLNNPQQLDVTQSEKEEFQKLPNNLINSDLLITDNSEIWVKSENKDDNILVTRITQPIKKVAWYSDKNHILFQVDSQIRVADLDGSNNIKLIDLTNDKTTEIMVVDNGKSILYLDGDQIKKAKIRD